MLKTLRAAPLLVVVPLVVVACQAQDSTPNPSITYSGSGQGSGLVVRGLTDLPQGARLRVELALKDSIDPVETQESVVSNGAFMTTFDLTDWPRAPSDIWVVFDPGDDPSKPAEVAARYGSNAERMVGPNVQEDSVGLRAFVSVTTVSLGDT
jgi:hypothetical protein